MRVPRCVVLVALGFFGACGAPQREATDLDSAPDDVEAQALSYATDVAPIVERRCFTCHNNLLSDHERIMTTTGWCWVGTVEGSEELPFVEPGDPERSLLLRKLRSPGADMDLTRSCGRPMPADVSEPPYGLEQIDPEEFAIIKAWIEHGAAE